MAGYIFRRLLATAPVMLLVAIFVFALLYVAGGDPAYVLAGDGATPDKIAAIRAQYGLDQPPVVRFFVWLFAMIQGDLGTSLISRQPVSHLILQRIEPTLSLALVTIVLAIVVAVPLGVAAAWKSGSAIDRLVTALSVAGFSLPIFVVAYVLVYLFSLELGWTPVQGFVSLRNGVLPFFSHIALPAFAISLSLIGVIARITRTCVLEVMTQDYIRTAFAKGLWPRQILARHAFKNAAVPIVTVIGLAFANLIGGVVVTESVFAIPGLGRLVTDAIAQRDYPVIQAMVLVLSLFYVLVNLLVDLSYVLFDPRIRY
jgi:peptide/nickel transport system permease protein